MVMLLNQASSSSVGDTVKTFVVSFSVVETRADLAKSSVFDTSISAFSTVLAGMAPSLTVALPKAIGVSECVVSLMSLVRSRVSTMLVKVTSLTLTELSCWLDCGPTSGS